VCYDFQARTGIDMTAAPYVLYGSHASYHTAKTRAYLRKKGLPFIERVPAHPRFREYVRPTSGNHRIPQLEAPDGTVIQDSAAIVAFLEERHPAPPMRPPGMRQQLVCRLLEVMIDVQFLRPAWHYRWNYMDENYDFVGREFGRSFRPTGTNEELEHYGRLIADRMEGYRGAIDGGDDLHAVLEVQVDELWELLEQHFIDQPYLFGGRPSVADTVLQGPLYGHLARDPVPAMRMKQRAPRVYRFTEHMNTPEVAQPELADVPHDYAAGDTVPDAALQLLQHCVDDQLPALLESARLFDEWAGDPGRRALPAGTPAVEGVDEPVIARFDSTLRGAPAPAMAQLHTQWLLQDVRDWYQALPVEGRAACEALARDVGAIELMALDPCRRLARAASIITLA
jgi:glutathione S-transferase